MTFFDKSLLVFACTLFVQINFDESKYRCSVLRLLLIKFHLFYAINSKRKLLLNCGFEPMDFRSSTNLTTAP